MEKKINYEKYSWVYDLELDDLTDSLIYLLFACESALETLKKDNSFDGDYFNRTAQSTLTEALRQARGDK